MLSLQQLTTPVSEDDALQSILDTLTELGFQATAWQSGSIQLTLLRLFAKSWANVTSTISDIASGGFTTLAAGLSETSWLRLLAKYVYDLDFLPAQKTIGRVLLTSSAGAPLSTWSAGDLVVSDSPSGTSGANTYTCTAGGSLGPSATLSLEFKADVAGAAANIPTTTTLYMWTPLVGVTVTNPAYGATTTWITTPGADEEDNARLLARCLGRWAKLTYSNTNGAYVGWALDALPALSRATMQSAAGDGTAVLVGATSTGPIDAGQITTIENFVNGVGDGVGRRPINDVFTAVGASALTGALNITAYCTSDVVATAATAITQALLTYIGSIPIGGVILTGTQGRVPFSKLVSIAQSITGVRSTTWSISSDVLLTPSQIYTPTITVTTVTVAPGS